MADIKMFLDFEGLSQYDELIKAYIDAQNQLDQGGLTDVVNDLAEVGGKVEAAEGRLDSAESAIEAAEGRLDNAESAIDVLNGDGDGSVSKQVSDAIASLIDAAPESFDTLKEIADWIAADETASAALVSKVEENESAIADLQQANVDIKSYVDAQDKNYYDSIGSIASARINGLFLEPVIVAQGQSVQEAVNALEEGQKLVLTSNSVVAENITVPENAYIDANGSEFSGNVVIPNSAVIDNAIFSGKVTIG